MTSAGSLLPLNTFELLSVRQFGGLGGQGRCCSKTANLFHVKKYDGLNNGRYPRLTPASVTPQDRQDFRGCSAGGLQVPEAFHLILEKPNGRPG